MPWFFKSRPLWNRRLPCLAYWLETASPHGSCLVIKSRCEAQQTTKRDRYQWPCREHFSAGPVEESQMFKVNHFVSSNASLIGGIIWIVLLKESFSLSTPIWWSDGRQNLPIFHGAPHTVMVRKKSTSNLWSSVDWPSLTRIITEFVTTFSKWLVFTEFSEAFFKNLNQHFYTFHVGNLFWSKF